MASIYPRNKTWWISYRKDGKNIHRSLKTQERAVARYKKNELENQLSKGDAPIADLNQPASRIYDAWIASLEHRLASSTLICYKSFVKPFMDWLGPAPLKAITPEKVDQYLKARLTPKDDEKTTQPDPVKKPGKPVKKRTKSSAIAPRTANHALKYLKTMLNYCVAQGDLPYNPLHRMKPIRIDVTPPKFLSLEEMAELRKAAKTERIELMVAVAIYTGMRLGELERLKWSDIDLKSGRITVYKAKSRKFRVIPIHQDLVKILRKNIPDMSGIDSPCFDMVNGRRIFRRVKIRANLPWIGWHTIRHSFASHLYQQTKDIVTVKEILGHADIGTTMIYTHLVHDHKTAQMDKLHIKVKTKKPDSSG